MVTCPTVPLVMMLSGVTSQGLWPSATCNQSGKIVTLWACSLPLASGKRRDTKVIAGLDRRKPNPLYASNVGRVCQRNRDFLALA